MGWSLVDCILVDSAYIFVEAVMYSIKELPNQSFIWSWENNLLHLSVY